MLSFSYGPLDWIVNLTCELLFSNMVKWVAVVECPPTVAHRALVAGSSGGKVGAYR